MSAWPDQPDDFVRWATRRQGESSPGAFLPRRLYGEYVRESLLTADDEASRTAELSVCFDEARRISRRPGGGWMVNLARSASTAADAVVLAIGHRSPTDPIGRLWAGPRNRFIADPWRAFAANGIRGDEPVAIVGSGLTAVDAVLTMSQELRSAPVTLISRRGFAPQSHAAAPAAPADLRPLSTRLLETPGGVRTKDLLRRVRETANETLSAGGDWRSVVDGVRPYTAQLWQAMSSADRRRFLTHLRPFWEMHRHRMAPEVAAKFAALRASGKVRSSRVESHRCMPTTTESGFTSGSGASRVSRSSASAG